MRNNKNEKCSNNKLLFRPSTILFLIQSLLLLRVDNRFRDVVVVAFSTTYKNALPSSFLYHKPSILFKQQPNDKKQNTELFFSNRPSDEVHISRTMPKKTNFLDVNNNIVSARNTRNSKLSIQPFIKLPSSSSLLRLSSKSQQFAADNVVEGGKALDDAEDWTLLLSALEMYKAAFGDLKVPSRFIVPSSSPWPPNTWELKLGQRIALIRSTGKHIDDNEERRKLLDDMGFVWRMRSPKPISSKSKTKSTLEEDGITISQIYTALEYYRLHVDSNPVKIPDYFIVPNCDPWPEETRGLPLGKKLSIILKNIGYYMNEADIDIIPKLKSYGVEVSDYFVQQTKKNDKATVNDMRWNNVFLALQTYLKLNENLLVPQPFVVPEEAEWPEEVWGLRLGARVNAIRSQDTFIKNSPERRESLVELGFVWDLSGNRKKAPRKKKKAGEELPYTIPELPVQEILPLDNEDIDESPSSSSIITPDDEDPIVVEETEKVATTFDLSSNYMVDSQFLQQQQQQQMQQQQQQKTDKESDEDSFVPETNFEDTIPWVEKRAMAVGIVDHVRPRNVVKKGQIYVNHPWYNDDFGDDFTFDDVVEALTVCQSINGNFDVLNDVEFVIPEPDDEDDLGDLSDYFASSGENTGELGDISASASLAAQAIASAEDLHDIEGSSEVREQMIQDEIQRMQKEMSVLEPDAAALAAMEDLELDADDASLLDISNKKNKESWPEYLAGMKLGLIARRIREGDLEVKHLPERKEKLDAISFDWGDSKKFLDIPFEKTMCALFAYYMIRGDLFVYEDFLMPNEDPWPKSLAGFELGKAVFRLRAKQKMLERYHPQKKYMLNMLEFVWFPLEYALPLDDEEEPLTWEQEQVRHVGHPLARINAPPLSAVEHVHPVDHPEAQDRYEFSYDLVKNYYEKELGITDVGEFLRERGYMELADEHEEKYGKPSPLGEGDDDEMDDYDLDVEEDDEYDDFEYEFDENDDVVVGEEEDVDEDDIELDLDEDDEEEEEEETEEVEEEEEEEDDTVEEDGVDEVVEEEDDSNFDIKEENIV